MAEGDSTAAPDIFVDLSFNLIQVLRLAQALAEAGCRLHVSAEDVAKVSQLEKIFGLRYVIGREGVPTLPRVSVDHMKPETRVGSIVRPLIFPQAAFDYCRSRWPETRRVRASFPGKPTASRRSAIDTWLALSGLKLRVPDDTPSHAARLLRRLAEKVARRAGITMRKPRQSVFAEGVKILLSDDGRVFPKKSWNTDYYAALLEAEFVLCPDGDFSKDGVAWTYRFFESILCGAIPVIENSCPAYAGFRFRTMREPLGSLVWSRADAEANFELALQRLSVDAASLREEVAALLRHAGPGPVNAAPDPALRSALPQSR
jgi:hypothetical protein